MQVDSIHIWNDLKGHVRVALEVAGQEVEIACCYTGPSPCLIDEYVTIHGVRAALQQAGVLT